MALKIQVYALTSVLENIGLTSRYSKTAVYLVFRGFFDPFFLALPLPLLDWLQRDKIGGKVHQWIRLVCCDEMTLAVVF